jgi:CheY-like chemotaxis protein
MSRLSSILVAEDDENDVFFLKRAFSEAEIPNPVHFVRDGQGVIDYLTCVGEFVDRRQYGVPLLVILDLKMPRKTGLQVLEWLSEREDLRCLPVMVLSSSAYAYDIDRAYQLGANAFVTKPSGVPERIELARMIKGFWLRFNEPPNFVTVSASQVPI